MPPQKPPVDQIHAFLRKNNALIVHFSGAPAGGGSNFRNPYPSDLQTVISGKAQSGLACSLVLPSDRFETDRTGELRNALGCIGVILGLESPASLLRVSPTDAGSYIDDQGRRIYYPEPDITLDDCQQSLDGREGHNEWGVRNYIVLGILAAAPFDIWIVDEDTNVPGATGYLDHTSLGAITSQFPDQNIYTFDNGALVGPKTITELYP